MISNLNLRNRFISRQVKVSMNNNDDVNKCRIFFAFDFVCEMNRQIATFMLIKNIQVVSLLCRCHQFCFIFNFSAVYFNVKIPKKKFLTLHTTLFMWVE